MNKKAMLRKIRRTLRRSFDHGTFDGLHTPRGDSIGYMYTLVKGKLCASDDVLVYAGTNGQYVCCRIGGDQISVKELGKGPLDFCEELFAWLQQGYTILDMTRAAYIEVWYMLSYVLRYDLKVHFGLNAYMSYCRQHGITYHRLPKFQHYTGLNAMFYYKRGAYSPEDFYLDAT